ncbi:MAG: carboxypeptidase regulatory-like domain-containing protein [Armatimonadetes bacterium]|nr:carboxypeptidase regulatory-like domain-containing protein [Armatimonadota bacterium]
MKKWIWISLTAVVVTALIAGCGGGGGGSGVTLSGKVVDVDGRPVQGARVALGTKNATTAVDGSFTLTGLVIGSGTLTVQHDNYEIYTLPVTIVAGQNTLAEDVVMAPVSGTPPEGSPRTMEGTITLAGGSNPSGVNVILLASGIQQDSMLTGSDGKFYFWAPQGTYTVRAAKSGFVPQEQQVVVTDLTQVKTVDFTLQPL